MSTRIRYCLTLLPLLLAGCPSRTQPEPPSTRERRADGSIVLAGASAAYVRSEPAGPANLEQSRSLVAKISFDERHVAKMGPPVGGRVASINVVTGDAVKAGSPLLTIHAPDIATAQAQVAQGRSARLLAEKVAARAATLVRDGAGSEAERQQADAALVQAQNEEQRAVAPCTRSAARMARATTSSSRRSGERSSNAT